MLLPILHEKLLVWLLVKKTRPAGWLPKLAASLNIMTVGDGRASKELVGETCGGRMFTEDVGVGELFAVLPDPPAPPPTPAPLSGLGLGLGLASSDGSIEMLVEVDTPPGTTPAMRNGLEGFERVCN